MNDGYIAVWFLTIGIILFMTGWQEQVADQLSQRSLSLILAGAFMLQFVTIPIISELAVKGSVVYITAVTAASLLLLRRPGTIVYVLVCGVLTGMICLWIRYMYLLDPVFILLNPAWDGPLIAGLFAGLLCDRFRTQSSVVVIAAVISPLHAVIHTWNGMQFVIGSLAWWDGLMISLMVARVIGNSKGWLRRKTLPVMDEPSGQRGGG
ncbi:hypothetical protein ACFPYJ_17300 [Paenibacillus solisilvae]|uniref:Uncharacterized protein n=1 Tax=Paenibacillus solisilvae TaxID=2486751 RepID=A0ABW0VY68_9BACL